MNLSGQIKLKMYLNKMNEVWEAIFLKENKK
jgi:hypothetical protein